MKNIFLLVISICVSLAFAEGALRLVYSTDESTSFNFRIPHPVFGWTLQPSVKYRYVVSGAEAVSVEYNSDGWRDVERRTDVSQSPNHVTESSSRAFLLGDSFMEAYTVGWQDTFSARLAKIAGSQGTKLDVRNFGVGGYGTLQQLLVYESQAKKIKHDLVLLGFYLGNDLRNNAMPLEKISGGNSIKATVRPFLMDEEVGDWNITQVDYEGAQKRFQLVRDRRESIIWRSSRYSVLLGKVLTAWEDKFPAYTMPPSRSATEETMQMVLQGIYFCNEPPEYTQAWDTTKRIFERLKKLTIANNSKLVVFSVPGMIEINATDEERAIAKSNKRPLCLDDPPAYERLRTLLSNLDIVYVDLLPHFKRSEKQLFRLADKHWNEAGHRLAASVVYEDLKAKSLVDQQ